MKTGKLEVFLPLKVSPSASNNNQHCPMLLLQLFIENSFPEKYVFAAHSMCGPENEDKLQLFNYSGREHLTRRSELLTSLACPGPLGPLLLIHHLLSLPVNGASREQIDRAAQVYDYSPTFPPRKTTSFPFYSTPILFVFLYTYNKLVRIYTGSYDAVFSLPVVIFVSRSYDVPP